MVNLGTVTSQSENAKTKFTESYRVIQRICQMSGLLPLIWARSPTPAENDPALGAFKESAGSHCLQWTLEKSSVPFPISPEGSRAPPRLRGVLISFRRYWI